MVEQGVVTDIIDGRLIVNIKRHAACGSCKACGMREGEEMTLELENTIAARKGDSIMIELDDLVILKGAFLFYGAPLSGLLLGILAGRILAEKINVAAPSEVISALFGIIAMIAAFIAVRRYNSANKERYKPRAIKNSV